MSRLRYPFTEISARCRLCGAVGFTASSEHALGGRLIDWRRAHARVCTAWPTWAEAKGLRLDDNGALLYPNEQGPYEPRNRPKSGEEADENEDSAEPEAPLIEGANGRDDDATVPAQPRFDLMKVPADQLEQTSLF